MSRPDRRWRISAAEPGTSGAGAAGCGARLAFAAAVVLNLVAVYSPSDAGGAALFPYADKLAHVLVFGLVAWTGRLVGLPAVPLFAVLGVHAVVSEVVQAALLPGRAGDPGDVAADVAGVLLGLALAARGRRVLENEQPMRR